MIAALLLVLRAQGEIPKFREQLGDLWACAVADLNNDGKPDIVIAGGKRIKIYWNEDE